MVQETYQDYKNSGIEWIGEIPKGWEIKRIKFISSSLDDGDWVESKDQVENGEYKLIQLKNIGEGKIIKTIDKSINKKFFEKNNCREITDGDLLIARIPEPILRCSIFNKNRFPNSISVVDATIITLKKEYYNKFVEYYFNSHYSKSIGSLLMYGATRQRISRTNISNMNIFLPSLKQQEQIVDYLDNQTQKSAVYRDVIEK